MADIQRRFGRGSQVDRQQFSQLLNEVGPEYAPIADKLFEAFDKDRSGRLSANELAGGMSVLAGKMNKTDKLNLMFDLYDRDRTGSISRTDMSEFMESMYMLAVKYVDDQVKDLSGLLGGDTPYARRAQLGTGSDILSDMQRQLRSKLKNHTQMVVERAFAQSRGGQLSKSEFTRWAQDQPKMFNWITELGKKMVLHIQKQDNKRYDSAVRRQLKNVTLEEVRQITQQVVRESRVMRETDIREVLQRVNLKNPQLMRRVSVFVKKSRFFNDSLIEIEDDPLKNDAPFFRSMSTFDRDSRGVIATHEFVSSMAMLCSGGTSRQKLEFAFKNHVRKASILPRNV